MDQLNQFIVNHWVLWLVFAILACITLGYELISQKRKAKQISPQSAIGMMNDDKAIVVDLREKIVFNQGHILGSKNASIEDFEQAKMEQYKNKTIILTCARGLLASAAAPKIRALGFEPLVLEGGISAWQEANLPLVKGKG